MNGYFDIHTHGAVNVDSNTASVEELLKLNDFYAQHGVGQWLPTIMTDSIDNTCAAIGRVVEAMKVQKTGAKILGIHLEGPFLNPDFCGAQPKEYLLEGDCKLMEKFQKCADGHIVRMTVAPEIPGCCELIKNFKDSVQFSMGHSNATYDEAMKAIKLGASSTTHTGNAMRLFNQHEAGLLGAALESDIWCEVIGDGIHVADNSFRVLLKAKGAKRIMVITDSMSATGMGDGNFILGGGNKVTVKGWDAKLTGTDVRAGSVLTMDVAFENIKRFTGLNDEQVLPMFGQNQAEMLGL